jgi:thymidylate kinase
MGHAVTEARQTAFDGRPARLAKPTIVEFTGVTGAGKSTLVAEVHKLLRQQGYVVLTASEALLASYGVRGERNGKMGSILTYLGALPWFLRFAASPRGSRLCRMALRVLRRDADNLTNLTRVVRNLAKRFGIHAALHKARRALPDCDFILWDEGTLHSIHNVFVHVGAAPEPKEVARYLALLPRPDLAVCVTAPPEQSFRCTRARGHARVADDDSAAEAFITNAHTVFQMLRDLPSLQGRMLVIDNPACAPSERDHCLQERAERVVRFLSSRRA